MKTYIKLDVALFLFEITGKPLKPMEESFKIHPDIKESLTEIRVEKKRRSSKTPTMGT